MNRKPPPPPPDDRALWDQVAKTVAPLAPRRSPAPQPPAPGNSETSSVAKPPPAGPLTAVPSESRRASKPPALSPLDRRTRGRLARGATGIDRRIDLHGMTQAAAHRRLLTFLGGAQTDGARLVLVITGKGRPSDAAHGDTERGVLKRMVPIWLAAPELRSIVIGFETAAPAHGGDGALYVRIRRARG